MNLRQLLDDAERQINTYKHPSIDEFRKAINEVLEAADLGSTGNDEITSIDEYSEKVRISTAWSCRGCDQSSDFYLPSFIIDSGNPVKAARIWSLEKKVAEAARSFEHAKKSVVTCEESLAKFTQELKEAQ